MGDFGARMDLLAEKVGGNFCVGKVVVDQVYAQYIHEDLALRHPHGGGAQYLSKPLFLNRFAYLAEVARTCLDDGGVRGMAVAMEHLAGGVGHSSAPIRGQGGGGLGALARLPASGGFPTVGESGPAGSWGVAAFAPSEFGDLKASGHPIVYSPSSTIQGDGNPRYDRAPSRERLSEATLRAEDSTVPYSGALIGWIWRHAGHFRGRRGGA